MVTDDYKLPRLYVDEELQENGPVAFGPDQAHYLKNVMRCRPGDHIRAFNGRQGEWLLILEHLGKKSAEGRAAKHLFPQPDLSRQIHLAFSPIKKARMDFLIEKAVELGATHLHPVMTHNTETRKIREERLSQQITEACAQCERLDIPYLFPLKKLKDFIGNAAFPFPLHACIERTDAQPLQNVTFSGNIAFLIGPEGGFTKDETAFLQKQDFIKTISLGREVLRAETAALVCLAHQKFT